MVLPVCRASSCSARSVQTVENDARNSLAARASSWRAVASATSAAANCAVDLDAVDDDVRLAAHRQLEAPVDEALEELAKLRA